MILLILKYLRISVDIWEFLNSQKTSEPGEETGRNKVDIVGMDKLIKVRFRQQIKNLI